MFVIIDIYSKNYKSLKNFLLFFKNENLLKKLKIHFLKNKTNNRTKKKVITVLKSPHVNKTAQEKFEYRVYKKKIKCFTPQILLLLIFLKKLRLNIFSDINFKLNLITNNTIEKKNKKSN